MSRLDAVIADLGPDLAPYTVADPDPGPGRFVSIEADERAYVLEAVYEGYLLHYGEPRAFTRMDPDLRLLAGDALYAQGLARLTEVGDLDAVAELSDLISLCAWAEAEGRRELVERLWDASSRKLLGGQGEGARAELGPDLTPAG